MGTIGVSLLVAASGCGDDPDSDGPDARQVAAARKCIDLRKPQTFPSGGFRRPSRPLDPSQAYDIVFRTNCGSFTVRLAVRQSPNATASFAALTRERFYFDMPVPRVFRGKYIETGDPTATGTGGPGYTTRDDVPANVRYRHGVVVMAKEDGQPAGTAGSRFFILTGDDPPLEREHAILGRVVHGFETVSRIDALGSDSGEMHTYVALDEATVFPGRKGSPPAE